VITVEQAQALCLALVQTAETETIALADADGRTLADPLMAKRDQPPFPASAMDGYAIHSSDAKNGATLTVIAESAAGHGWSGTLKAGQAVRIFTGAPVPSGADQVVIQENVTREKYTITLGADAMFNINIRQQGADFKKEFILKSPRKLRPSDLALIAAMNHATVRVIRRPKVALISTGDELLMPGGDPAPDQIIASNVFALKAMLSNTGAVANVLPIAPDTPEGLDDILQQAEDWGADIIVTIGGASVGDHDLVAPALNRFGVNRSFHKIAMRPGKPLMAGAKGVTAFLGLPGNPVSAVVCSHLFLLPMVRSALGLSDVLPRGITARLEAPIPAGGPRAHYMRAHFTENESSRTVTPFAKQDSSMLTVLAEANCLLLSPIDDTPKVAGDLAIIYPI
jgi:molybdopterin molybdotransferase